MLARAIADADRPRIILNADDFGRSTGIKARRTPSLAVGLPLVLADGRPALPAREIPHVAFDLILPPWRLWAQTRTIWPAWSARRCERPSRISGGKSAGRGQAWRCEKVT